MKIYLVGLPTDLCTEGEWHLGTCDCAEPLHRQLLLTEDGGQGPPIPSWALACCPDGSGQYDVCASVPAGPCHQGNSLRVSQGQTLLPQSHLHWGWWKEFSGKIIRLWILSDCSEKRSQGSGGILIKKLSITSFVSQGVWITNLNIYCIIFTHNAILIWFLHIAIFIPSNTP